MSLSSEANWHYSDGTSSYGPLPTSVIRQMISAGVIRPNATFRRDGESSWQSFAGVDFYSPDAAGNPEVLESIDSKSPSEVAADQAMKPAPESPWFTAIIVIMVLAAIAFTIAFPPSGIMWLFAAAKMLWSNFMKKS